MCLGAYLAFPAPTRLARLWNSEAGLGRRAREARFLADLPWNPGGCSLDGDEWRPLPGVCGHGRHRGWHGGEREVLGWTWESREPRGGEGHPALHGKNVAHIAPRNKGGVQSGSRIAVRLVVQDGQRREVPNWREDVCAHPRAVPTQLVGIDYRVERLRPQQRG